MSSSKLFQPTHVGDIELLHRVVLAPLTRFRSTDTHVPGPLVAEHYAQRASVPGTLLVTEGTFISPNAGGSPNVPGIWSEDQIKGWRKVTDAVHAKKSFIYAQLWALGRAADPKVLEKEGLPDAFIAPSPIGIKNKDSKLPREATVAEIKEYVQLYATAASNAIKAGFDGVELHGANGYFIDQFLQDVSNQRTDEYGGSVENRVRFAKEIVDAVVKNVGAKRTAIRVSPWGRYQDMHMQDPFPTFTHLFSTLLTAHPQLAYIHVVEPRADGASTRTTPIPVHESNDFIRQIVREKGNGTQLISAGTYTRELGMEVADKKGDLVAYGRLFLANPDLPLRLKQDIPLNEGNRKTYYLYGNFTPLGYTDYPFADPTASVASIDCKWWQATHYYTLTNLLGK